MQALLIEDNRIFQIKLRNILNSLGYEVTIVSSVKESVVCLKTEKFDLLICDIVLSDGEFFDIDTVPVVPTIFITAYENPTYMEKALKANNAVFIVKPFSDLTFIAAVKNVTVKVAISDDLVTVFGKYKTQLLLLLVRLKQLNLKVITPLFLQ
jgi:CheY-like chemotaxis protein